MLTRLVAQNGQTKTLALDKALSFFLHFAASVVSFSRSEGEGDVRELQSAARCH